MTSKVAARWLGQPILIQQQSKSSSLVALAKVEVRGGHAERAKGKRRRRREIGVPGWVQRPSVTGTHARERKGSGSSEIWLCTCTGARLWETCCFYCAWNDEWRRSKRCSAPWRCWDRRQKIQKRPSSSFFLFYYQKNYIPWTYHRVDAVVHVKFWGWDPLRAHSLHQEWAPGKFSSRNASQNYIRAGTMRPWNWNNPAVFQRVYDESAYMPALQILASRYFRDCRQWHRCSTSLCVEIN